MLNTSKIAGFSFKCCAL